MDSQDLQQQFRQLMQHWFLRYNPLYFFSALCVLSGVYMISVGLEDFVWTRGQLALSGIVQCYEFLSIGSAALLYRRSSFVRPAVILGLIELSFLFDSTFRAEVFTTVDFSGSWLSAIWIALFVFKVSALLWAFRLNVPMADMLPPLAAASLTAVVPQLLDRHYAHAEMLHVGATCFGAFLVAALVWRQPAVRSFLPLSEWGRTVLQRILYSFQVLVGVFYVLHLFSWLHVFSLNISVLHLFAVLLSLPLVTRQKAVVWVGCAIVLAGCFSQAIYFAPLAAVVGLVFLMKAVQLQEAHFYIASLITFYLSAWTIGWQHWPLPPIHLWLSLVAVLVLVLLAWKLKLPSALSPLLVGLYPFAKLFVSLSQVQRGSILLAIGFAALLLGLGINWRQSSRG